ncbi:MAG: hypothetical protein ACXVW2_11330 [Nocardioidaceae bacterium]
MTSAHDQPDQPDEPADTDQPDQPADRRTAAEKLAAQRRLAEVFGDVLPDRTSDERGDWGDDRGSSRDDEYRRNRPPHHG